MVVLIFVFSGAMEVPKDGDVIEVTAFWTWMGDDGICRTKVKPGAEIEIQHALENSEATNSIHQRLQEDFALLVDATDIKSMSREAREHFSMNKRETHLTALAIITGSPVSRVIANFFMGIQKQRVICRTFTDESKAIKWLQENG